MVVKLRNAGMEKVLISVKNIFDAEDWKKYDYQKDIQEDPELQSVKPVGREVVD
ncbi:MAG: hypothetical protein ACI4T3_06680 [Lactobacillus sp.]